MDLQTETETAEAAYKAPTAMHEPVYIPSARPAFVTTKNEENLLTVLRNLPKADVEEIRRATYGCEISEFKEKEIDSGSECEPIINN